MRFRNRPSPVFVRYWSGFFSQDPYIGFGNAKYLTPNSARRAGSFRAPWVSIGKSWMLSPTHASTLSGGMPGLADPDSIRRKRGVLLLTPGVWQRTGAAGVATSGRVF